MLMAVNVVVQVLLEFGCIAFAFASTVVSTGASAIGLATPLSSTGAAVAGGGMSSFHTANKGIGRWGTPPGAVRS